MKDLRSRIRETVEFIKKEFRETPDVAIILGTALAIWPRRSRKKGDRIFEHTEFSRLNGCGAQRGTCFR